MSHCVLWTWFITCLHGGGGYQVSEVACLTCNKKNSPCLPKIIQPWDPMVKFLEVVLANVTWTWSKLRGLPHLERFMWQKLRPSLTGLPCHAADQATHLGRLHQLLCNNDQDKIRDYTERQVTPSRQVTTPMLRSSPPCRQALKSM